MEHIGVILDEMLSSLGGEDNILAATNCMTRLRITVADENRVEVARLENLEDVLAVVHDRANYYEIVVGPGKCKAYVDALHSRGIGGTKTRTSADAVQHGKRHRIRAILKVVGDIFVPMIPGIIAAGLCAGFASMITQLCPGYADYKPLSILYSFLTLISTSYMTYITAWAGYRAAECFGATPILGGMLGMITSLDGINQIAQTLGLYNNDQPLASLLCSGKGGVLAAIFGVYLLSIIEKNLRRRIPAVLDAVFTPLLTLIICVCLYVAIVMPFFGVVSSCIASLIGALCLSPNIIVRVLLGYVSAATFLPLVATGMHHGLVALYTVQLEELGYVTLYPALAMAGAGQVGAGLAIWRKARRIRNTKLSQVIAGALPAGILGVGEPLVYGVTLPLGKPFITAGLGAGFGGALVMAMEVGSTTWGPSGVLGVFVMTAGPNGFVTNALVYFAGLVISYIGGFVLTTFAIGEDELIQKG